MRRIKSRLLFWFGKCDAFIGLCNFKLKPILIEGYIIINDSFVSKTPVEMDNDLHIFCVCIYVCIYIYVCVCIHKATKRTMCVCVCIHTHTHTLCPLCCSLKLHSPMIFKSLHYFEINISD